MTFDHFRFAPLLPRPVLALRFIAGRVQLYLPSSIIQSDLLTTLMAFCIVFEEKTTFGRYSGISTTSYMAQSVVLITCARCLLSLAMEIGRCVYRSVQRACKQEHPGSNTPSAGKVK